MSQSKQQPLSGAITNIKNQGLTLVFLTLVFSNAREGKIQIGEAFIVA
jgi:hypothetical protein